MYQVFKREFKILQGTLKKTNLFSTENATDRGPSVGKYQ
jgi:hypothetical protein